ncbi:MAG: ATP-binding protein [Trueperaceae bacterium]
MSLKMRFIVAVALTALFSVTLTGFLSYRAAGEHVPRAFGRMWTARFGAAADERQTPMGAELASEELLGTLRRATIQAAAIAMAVAAAAGGWLAIRTSKPIDRLAEVTRRHGAGERDLRADVHGPNEVAELARVFNTAADQIRDEEEQRKRFTTDVAHELRTPLTILKSELEAIQDGLMQADPENVGQLLQQVDLLTRLVQDLRTLTLAEAGELSLERNPIDLGSLVTSALGAFTSRASTAEVLLESTVQPDVLVAGDGERLLQVINALMDNALRHVPEGGRIDVDVRRRATATDEGAALESAVVSVCDDGPGVPEEHLQHLFQRFYRADPARSRASGGSGLGLAIVAAIVALHGGSVEATARPGGGTCFCVWLPATGAR